MKTIRKLIALIAAIALLLTCAAFADEAADSLDAYAGGRFEGLDPWGNPLAVSIRAIGDGMLSWTYTEDFYGELFYQEFEDTELVDGVAQFHAEGALMDSDYITCDYTGTIALRDGTIVISYAAGEMTESSPEGGSTAYHVEPLEDEERTVVLDRVAASTPEAAVFEGRWGCGRATLDISQDGDAWRVQITWADSAAELARWDYTCLYDEAENCLYSVGFAHKFQLLYDEGGEVASSEIVYDDGRAAFRFDGEGSLLWEDMKEDAGDGMAFEYSGIPNEIEPISTRIVKGSFVIQIPMTGRDMAWVADDMAQDDSVVALYDADVIEDTFVVRYDPVGDGDVSVGVSHYAGIACDERYTWDLRVADGAVLEVIGGSYTASPDEADMDPLLSGEWLETQSQLAQMTIAKGQERGWDVEIVTPATHGAYVFKTTVYYDCELNAFVYDKGKFFEAPITDSEDAELGEAVIAGATGSFTLEADDESGSRLVWYSDVTPEETVTFAHADG